MDFGEAGGRVLEISGRTPLEANTVNVRIKNGQGGETVSALEFDGKGGQRQSFPVRTPGGNCTVSFVFLPGSSFDFDSFRFHRPENWTEEKE